MCIYIYIGRKREAWPVPLITPQPVASWCSLGRAAIIINVSSNSIIVICIYRERDREREREREISELGFLISEGSTRAES